MTAPVPVTVLGDEVIVGGVVLRRVHHPGVCAGRPCVIHAPTGHHMRSWPLLWRDDRGVFERICRHGVGHPDPDQRDWWQEAGRAGLGVHGCDGCCASGGDGG